jgi:hypothetical protein
VSFAPVISPTTRDESAAAFQGQISLYNLILSLSKEEVGTAAQASSFDRLTRNKLTARLPAA